MEIESEAREGRRRASRRVARQKDLPTEWLEEEKIAFHKKFPTLKRGEVGAEDLEYRTEQQSWRRREMWEVLRYWLLRSVL